MRALIALATALLAGAVANAQICPPKDGSDPSTSAPSVVRGTLLFHDELRQWLGIKLNKPACGVTEVQLVLKSDASREADTLRGCAVTATGTLYYGLTGYYSSEIAMQDPALEPDPSCHPTPVETDPHSIAIPPAVKSYRAAITVDFHGKGHTGVQVWQDDDKSVSLTPWQAYVDFQLNGSAEIVWLYCQEDFVIKDIMQTPPNPNGIEREGSALTGAALQDPDGANVVRFTCQRKAKAPTPSPVSSPPHSN